MNEPYLVMIHIPNSKETCRGFAETDDGKRDDSQAGTKGVSCNR